MTESTEKSQPTVITLVLPAEGEAKPASLTIRQGDIGQVSTFVYQDLATICRAINTGLNHFLAVQAQPPGDVESAAKKSQPPVKTKRPTTAAAQPAGKPPYHLVDAAGKRRELLTMTDPFDVTEKCLNNRKLVFDDLVDAVEIAQLLVAAGEKPITIAYQNGQTARVIGETKPEEPAAAGAEKPVPAVYPEGIDEAIQQALYDHVHDATLALAIDTAVNKIKKYDWTNDLSKQREVKGAIHQHVDADEVEAIYAIFYRMEHPAEEGDEEGRSPATENEEQVVLL